ncbi:MAG: MBL fold metallo-hydrolase [Verrucomicrobia bacterium]|nr:MBL fold metallo-hydrolase [Verrucomicrobiota bacterium]MBI3868155.1 MBL fold metallo-hydrolase [Verrucomicrobiota bacterium]
MPARFTILASGSSGNCAYLETEDTRLLIDAGLSARQIRQRLLGLGRTPESLHGILITHEHSDHIQGLSVLAARLQIPVYCNRLTRDAIARDLGGQMRFQVFSTGSAFSVGDIDVENFSIPHDAQDPVGFLLRTRNGNVGFLTDLGHATRLVIERVKPAQILVLESNHDMQLLQEDLKRPWSVKQRIASRHGHLSNGSAAEAAAQVVSSHLSHLFLGHLSRDCNRPELAEKTTRQKLREIGASHVAIAVASPDMPSETICLDRGESIVGGTRIASPLGEPAAAGVDLASG